MKTEQMLDEIREANLTYLILAQRLLREDRAEAQFRLGVSEEVADILASLGTAQLVKIAASNMLLCRFRFDDEVVWNLLAGNARDKTRDAMGVVHAAILMATPLAEAA